MKIFGFGRAARWGGVVEVGSLLADTKRDFIFGRATEISISVAGELQSFVSFQGIAGGAIVA